MIEFHSLAWEFGGASAGAISITSDDGPVDQCTKIREKSLTEELEPHSMADFLSMARTVQAASHVNPANSLFK